MGSFFDKLFEKLDQIANPEAPRPDTLLGEYREVLEQAQRQPLPPGLEASAPRPDVWGQKGYLAQPRYEALYKPFLIHGDVTRAVVYRYKGDSDPDGRDVDFDYAWYVGPELVRTVHVRESYDALHAVFGAGKGDIVLDMDARLELGKVITLLHYGGQHLIYEALRTDPESDPAVLRARAEAEAAARRRAGPDPRQDFEQLSGRHVVWWVHDGQEPVLNLGKSPSSPPVCFLRRDAEEPGVWQLSRNVSTGVRPWLRILPVQSTGASSVWRIAGMDGQEVAQAKVRGSHLFVSQRGLTVMLTQRAQGGWTAEDGAGKQLFSCAPDPSGQGQRIEVGTLQLFIEAILLTLVAAGRPWSAEPEGPARS
jgi:hypothetical protein